MANEKGPRTAAMGFMHSVQVVRVGVARITSDVPRELDGCLDLIEVGLELGQSDAPNAVQGSVLLGQSALEVGELRIGRSRFGLRNGSSAVQPVVLGQNEVREVFGTGV